MAAGLPLETLTRKIVTLGTFYDIVTLLQYDWLAIVLLRNCVCVYIYAAHVLIVMLIYALR